MLSFDDHMTFDSLERNRLSNMSFLVQSIFELVVLATMVGILKGKLSDWDERWRDY